MNEPETDVNEYRGDVCMRIRYHHGHPDLADEVGGMGDEWMRYNYMDHGISVEDAALQLVGEHEAMFHE